MEEISQRPVLGQEAAPWYTSVGHEMGAVASTVYTHLAIRLQAEVQQYHGADLLTEKLQNTRQHGEATSLTDRYWLRVLRIKPIAGPCYCNCRRQMAFKRGKRESTTLEPTRRTAGAACYP